MSAGVLVAQLDGLGQQQDGVEEEVALLAQQLGALDAGGDAGGQGVGQLEVGVKNRNDASFALLPNSVLLRYSTSSSSFRTTFSGLASATARKLAPLVWISSATGLDLIAGSQNRT